MSVRLCARVLDRSIYLSLCVVYDACFLDPFFVRMRSCAWCVLVYCVSENNQNLLRPPRAVGVVAQFACNDVKTTLHMQVDFVGLPFRHSVYD